jgi:hypothetical protein
MEQYDVVRQIARFVSIPGIEPVQTHFGESYANSTEWWAVKLREADSTFAWLAYSFGDIPMWALHAGVVLTETGARVGLHCHKKAEPEYCEAVKNIGQHIGPLYDSLSADELQYNQDFSGFGPDVLQEVGIRLGQVYVDARSGLIERGLINK